MTVPPITPVIRRHGPGVWVAIQKPDSGVLWASTIGLGFTALPGRDHAKIDAIVAEANKLITLTPEQRFDQVLDQLIAEASDEEATKLKRTVMAGDLSTWEGSQRG